MSRLLLISSKINVGNMCQPILVSPPVSLAAARDRACPFGRVPPPLSFRVTIIVVFMARSVERACHLLIRPYLLQEIFASPPFVPVSVTADLDSIAGSYFGAYEDRSDSLVVRLLFGLAAGGCCSFGRQDEGLAVVVFSVEMDTFSHGYYAGVFSTRRAPRRVGGVCDDEVGVFNDQGNCCRPLLWLAAGVPIVSLVIVSQDWRQKGGGRLRSPFSFGPFLKALLVGFRKSCPLGLLLYLSFGISFNRLPAQLKHSLLGTVTHEQSKT